MTFTSLKFLYNLNMIITQGVMYNFDLLQYILDLFSSEIKEKGGTI